jgi:predicted nucleic acid-binding protein
VIVVDASMLASALADDGADGDRVRRRLAGELLFAPELIDLEVASVWRRAARSGRLDGHRAALALADLASVPVARAPHLPLMGRIWDLRANLTSYDAAYVALAEMLDSVLVTADRGLGGASGVECEVEVLS